MSPLKALSRALIWLSLPSLGLGLASSLPESLSAFIDNVVDIRAPSELYLIISGDSDEKTDTVRKLHEQSTPFSLYDLSVLRQLQLQQPEAPCPVYDNNNHAIDAINRVNLMFPVGRNQRSLFVWADEAAAPDEAFVVFNDTKVMCDQFINTGLFDANTAFFYYVGRNASLVEAVFEQDLMRTYPKVAAVKRVASSDPSNYDLVLYNSNIYSANSSPPALIARNVWSSSNGTSLRSELDVFIDATDFQNYTVRAAGMTWANFLIADSVNNSDPTKLFVNYWGLEVEMLRLFGRRFNFSFSIHNPADQQWGSVDPDGKWGGSLGEAASGRADIAIGCLNIYHSFAQVTLPSIPYFYDFRTLAAPLPRQRPKTMALVTPFSPLVWLCIAASVVVAAAFFFLVATAEAIMSGEESPPWDKFPDVYSLTLSHITSQCSPDSMKFVRGTALRCAITTWLMYAFLMVALYGGMLKGFLTAPSYYPQVRTLGDVLHSGLTWRMFDFGLQDEDIYLEHSGDPVVSKIWNDKIKDDYKFDLYLSDVFAGKLINIDYWSGLSPLVAVYYTTADGTPLIHVQPNPVVYINSPVGWSFSKFAYWSGIVDLAIKRAIEVGLLTKWTSDSLRTLKDQAWSSGHKTPSVEQRPDVSPMTLDDLLSAFIAIAFLLVLVVMLFFAELAFKSLRASSRI